MLQPGPIRVPDAEPITKSGARTPISPSVRYRCLRERDLEHRPRRSSSSTCTYLPDPGRWRVSDIAPGGKRYGAASRMKRFSWEAMCGSSPVSHKRCEFDDVSPMYWLGSGNCSRPIQSRKALISISRPLRLSRRLLAAGRSTIRRGSPSGAGRRARDSTIPARSAGSSVGPDRRRSGW